MPKKILITPKSYYKIRDKLLPMLKDYELKFNDTGKTFTEKQMIELSKEVDGIIIGVDPITKDVIENAKNLKIISKYGVGMDNIDIETAEKRNIVIKNTPGTNNISVAELTIGLIFDIARNISICINNVKNNNWQRIKGVELTNKTLGIIGCGKIGREVIKRALGLQMNILIHDPYFKENELLNDKSINLADKNILIKNSDFISLHLPFNSETENIISKNELIEMKNTAYLINTARGGLINEEDLLWALKNNEISGAACDVFSNEPPGKHPLLNLDNFVLTPHMGANTIEAVLRMATQATKNLLEFIEG